MLKLILLDVTDDANVLINDDAIAVGDVGVVDIAFIVYYLFFPLLNCLFLDYCLLLYFICFILTCMGSLYYQ